MEVEAQARELARQIVDMIADKKGENIVLLDLNNVSPIADYFVVGNAASDRQLNAIVDHIRQEVKKNNGAVSLRVEGRGESGWVLIDLGDVVVHLFSPQLRQYYDLESLWADANVMVRIQ